MEDDFVPSKTGKVIRFVCGFVIIGGTAFLFIAVRFPLVSEAFLLSAPILIGVVSGVLAARFGDKFWLKATGIFW